MSDCEVQDDDRNGVDDSEEDESDGRNGNNDSEEDEDDPLFSCKDYYFGMSWRKMTELVEEELKSKTPVVPHHENPKLKKIFLHFIRTVRRMKILPKHLREIGIWLKSCAKIFGRQVDSIHDHHMKWIHAFVNYSKNGNNRNKPISDEDQNRLITASHEIEEAILDSEPQDASAAEQELTQSLPESEPRLQDMETDPLQELPVNEPSSLIPMTVSDSEQKPNIQDIEAEPVEELLVNGPSSSMTIPGSENNIHELETQPLVEAQDLELVIENTNTLDADVPPADIPMQASEAPESNSESENLGPVPPKKLRTEVMPRIRKPNQPRSEVPPVLAPFFEDGFVNHEHMPHLRPSVRVSRIQVPVEEPGVNHIPDVFPNDGHIPDADLPETIDSHVELILADVVEVEVLDNRLQDARIVGNIEVPVPPWTLNEAAVEEFNSLILEVHHMSDFDPYRLDLAQSRAMLARVKEIIGGCQNGPLDQLPQEVPPPMKPAEVLLEPYGHTTQLILPIMRELQASEFKPESKDKPKFEPFIVRAKKLELSQCEVKKFMNERDKKVIDYWIFQKTAECNSFNFVSTLKKYYSRMERLIAESDRKFHEGVYSGDVTSLKDKLMSRLPEEGWTNAVHLLDERTRAVDITTLFELLACGWIEAKIPNTEPTHQNIDQSKIGSNGGGFAILHSRGLDLDHDQLLVRRRRVASNAHNLMPPRPVTMQNHVKNTTFEMDGSIVEMESGDTSFSTPPILQPMRRCPVPPSKSGSGPEGGRIRPGGAASDTFRRQISHSFNVDNADVSDSVF